jgi:uncharacterized membrane protein (UPF0127 family)
MVIAVVGCRRDEPPPSSPTGSAPAPASTAPAPAPAPDAPAVTFQPPGHPEARVVVELAISEHEVQRGLMYREYMPPDAGMIFLFRTPKEQHFWMKNTLIPLDMIFVGSDRRVVGVVADAEPQTLDSRAVDGPSQFVVEVNGGWAAAHGVAAGTPVIFEHVPVDRATVD